MGSKKRKLSGAAKAAREAKLARQEAQSAHEEAQQDPIELELNELTAASASGGTLQEATSRAEGYSPTGKKDDKTSEILLGCLKEFPPEGREILIRDILARDNASLKNLADSIRRWVFYPIKANGGRTPAPSPTPSASSSSQASKKKSEESIVKKAVSRSGQSKLKSICLSREGNRCILTGMYDTKKAATSLSPEERANTRKIHTECAHIIPYSAAPESISGEIIAGQLSQKAKTWAFLYRYFPRVRKLIDVHSAGSINLPRNAMTMASFMHFEFGNFSLAFEAIGPHEYRIKTFPSFSDGLDVHLPADRIVRLRSADGTELPDPGLLECHLAIANVLHATGMAEEIDRYIDESSEEEDLAEDAGIEMRVQNWLMATA